MSFKSGFVSIIGKTNAGKSTLINSIIGEKVAIVSPKPQTTRNKILGIYNKPECQIVFIDTPGHHPTKNKLDDFMQKSIERAQVDVDVTLLVVDGSKRITNADVEFVKSFDRRGTNAILVISKMDEANKEKLYPQLAVFNELKYIFDIIPISVHKNRNVDLLLEKIIAHLPEGHKYFDDDIYTDNSVKFLVSEIIREKALWFLQDEIPHGIAVSITAFKEKKKVVEIAADIICEKSSHKQIIIGKDGQKIKEIGTRARLDIEKLVDHKVSLTLYVKVREDWRKSDGFIKSLGYNLK